MNDIEMAERFSEMLSKSRTLAGKSQSYMAKKLNVSKRTIQNWEDGMSCPTMINTIKWFRILKAPALPFFLRALYPHEFENLDKRTDKEIEEALNMYLMQMPLEEKKKLLFVVYGEHGSSFPELIEMLTAHFHTPEANRITIAQNICTNFEIAKATGNLVLDQDIMPDISILKKAIIKKRNIILGTNDELKE